MSDQDKISLPQQIEALTIALTRQAALAQGTTIKPMRGKQAEQYDVLRLQAALRTLRWVDAHQDVLRQAHAHIAATKPGAAA